MIGEYTIVRIDIPGFGLSGYNRRRNYDMVYYTRFIDRFADLLDLKEFHLVGHSLGGWIAWEYALRNQGRILKLALINSAGFLSEQNIPTPIKLLRSMPLRNLLRIVISKNIVEQYVREVYFDQSKVSEQVVQRYYDMFNREGNPEAFYKLVNRRFKDNTAKLPEIKNDVLVMWGEEDRWLSVQNAYRFNIGLPNADLAVFPKIGHVPMEERWEETAEELLHFLD